MEPNNNGNLQNFYNQYPSYYGFSNYPSFSFYQYPYNHIQYPNLQDLRYQSAPIPFPLYSTPNYYNQIPYNPNAVYGPYPYQIMNPQSNNQPIGNRELFTTSKEKVINQKCNLGNIENIEKNKNLEKMII